MQAELAHQALHTLTIVEIKSFISASLFKDFELALDQYIIYRNLIRLSQSEYQDIHLAIKDDIYDSFFQRKSVQTLVDINSIALVSVDVIKEEVIQWIN
ncbi:element excision factor XisH family protein [[Limnothrix rosea] IAM M-220]|uniref:element excision factor XisH family protein n=1 Tax=[Limnothrix rosea] IAM M-220 TaxID=454133 RepID=UPI001C0D0581|nr:element excision factor XisH family protein [[Limnothrix rosea] IAM M-220]